MTPNLSQSIAELTNTPLAQFLLDAAVKATVLLAAAMIATWLLRRSSAAVRHRIWCLTFAALVLLPGLSALLPEWRLAVLPYSSPLAPREESRGPLAPQAVTTLAQQPTTHIENERARDALPLAEREDYGGSFRSSAEQVVALAIAPLAANDAVGYRPNLTTLWLIGTLIALAPLVIGFARTLLLRRQSCAIDDALWTSLLDDLRQRLALARRVGLYETASALMPMTWGVVRPVVMLPRQSREWTDRLRRIVLLHELAHVKRYDVGFQLLGRLTCALYWFHPLAWYGLRRLRIERELACDDCVVLAGERATDYAAELLQIARAYRSLPFAAAVAMAQRNNLEHRLRAMFDRACSHLPISARAARALLAGVLVLVTTIAAIRLAPRATADDDKQGASNEAQATDDDVITVTGTVVDPQGKPYAGAKVYAVRWYWEPHISHVPLAETTSAAGGRFTVSYRKSQFDVDIRNPEQWKSVSIVATADGLAPTWTYLRHVAPEAHVTLKLVGDDLPITGRVVDSEGRPVAGVAVCVLRVDTAKDDNLDAWLAAISRGEPPEIAFSQMHDMLQTFEGWMPHTTTDDSGRFTLTGIGDERVAHLELTGEQLAYSTPLVAIRRMEAVRRRLHSGNNDTEIVYGADFQFAAPPTRPIIGVIRDAESRQPLAGVSVEATRFVGGVYTDRSLRAVSDQAGCYRLSGLPKGKGNEVVVVPGDDQPYFMRDVNVPDAEGFQPVGLDIDLHRGIWISGRITDKVTGEPVVARVNYLPFLDNEFAQRTPEFGSSGRGDGFQGRYVSRADGHYRLVGLPGRAIIGAECIMRPYRRGVGANTITGLNEHGKFDTYFNPARPGKNWPNAMKEINPLPGTESVVCDLELDPGLSLTLHVVDADGKPLSGFDFAGRTAEFEPSEPPSEQPKIEVVNLGSDEFRTVTIRHPVRKLGKVLRVRLSDHPSGTLSVVAVPLGKIAGRLVDRDGDPVRASLIYPSIHDEGYGRLAAITTDDNGRFEVADLPTGCSYDLFAQTVGLEEDVSRDVSVSPGDVTDLGDVTIGSTKTTDTSSAEPSASKTEQPARPSVGASGPQNGKLRGRVLNSSGQPLAGATVNVRLAIFNAHDAPLGSTTTDADGRFKVAFQWPEFDERIGAKPDVCVMAFADGLAANWKHVVKDEPPGEIALRLSEKKSIAGRIVNAEGKPLVGIDVVVREIVLHDHARMQSILDDVAQGRNVGTFRDWSYGPLPKQPEKVTTDADGRFRIASLPADAVLELEIRGTGVRNTVFNATTALRDTIRGPVPTVEPPFGPLAARVLYGSQFEYVAEPGRRIQGVVRDRDSGRPVAQAKVQVNQERAALDGGLHSIEATTDSAGRYAVDGCGKEARSWFRVDPPVDGPAYFPAALWIDDVAGVQSIVKDIGLIKGIELRGRITDSQTGQPLVANISYAPLYLNKYAEPLYAQQANLHSRARSNTEGSFRIAVAPGPGAIAVSFPGVPPLTVPQLRTREARSPGAIRLRSISAQDFLTTRVSYDDVVKLFEASPTHRELAHSPDLKEGLPDALRTQENGGWSLLGQAGNAHVMLVCPDEQKPPEPIEVRLVRGRRIRGKVTDPDGYPLTGARAYLNNPGFFYQRLLTDEFAVTGLAPNDRREIAFHHGERRLGAYRTIFANEPEPLIVRLEPLGSAQGRVLDEDGAPIEGVHVWFYPWGDVGSAEFFAITGAEGRFRIDKLIPGLPYEVMQSQPDSMSYRQFSREKLIFSVGSGKTHELGDLVAKGPVQTVSIGSDATTSEASTAPEPAPKSQSTQAQRDAGDKATPQTAAALVVKPLEFRGRVIGTDGDAIADASVSLMYFANGSDDPKLGVRGTTRSDGSFDLRVPAEATVSVHGWTVVATKKGFGPGWAGFEPSDQTSNLTLKLARDAEPVEGRVIDMEGRPVVGMKVQVLTLERFPNDDPQPYLDSLKKGEEFQRTGWRLAADGPGDDRLIKAVQTDAQGKFKLYGIGQNRLAFATLVGGGVENSMIEIVTHAVPDGLQTPDHPPFTRHVYGPRFTHVARPSRTIVGIVTDAKTDAAIAGASVRSFPGMVDVVTGDDGRFSLTGCPKADDYRLLARVSHSGLSDAGTYIGGSAIVRDDRGLKPLEVKLHLYPAVLATGRVIDQATGQPVAAEVDYYPLYPNKHDVAGIASSGARAHGQYSAASTDAEGRFSLAVLPGPGCFCVRAVNDKRYALAQVDLPAFLDEQGIVVNLDAPAQAAQYLRISGFPENKTALFIGAGGGTVVGMQQSQFHAVALFSVAEDTERLVQDIELKLKAEEGRGEKEGQ